MTSYRFELGKALPRLRAVSAAPAFLLMLLAMVNSAQASTWIVTSTGDTASGVPAHCPSVAACTLRDAIAASGNGDTITFNVGANKTIMLTSNTILTLAANVTIDGSGSAALTIDGNHAVSVVLVNAGVTVAISHLTIANGLASVLASGHTLGGGIYNSGTLTLTNVSISGNAAYYGAGIFNNGTLTIVRCTIQLNMSTSEGGGIFQNAALPLNISASTIAGNTAAVNGGGIYNAGFLTVSNSTIQGNSAVFYGGGIDNEDPLTLVNDTFSGNTSGVGDGPDINTGLQFTANNTIFASGCRLVGAILGSNNLDAGTSCALAGANSNALLDLGPLQDNGGPTLTMLPGNRSQAIDAGLDASCSAAPVSAGDQRGIARPQGAHCDVGAVEVAPCYVKFDATGANDGSTWTDAYVDLQIALSDSGCDQVRVARGVYKPTASNVREIAFDIYRPIGVFGGFAGIGTLRDASAYPTVLSGDIDHNDLGTNGVDANSGMIVGDNSYHVVVMDGSIPGGITQRTILDGFTISGGKADSGAPNDKGGGLYCNGAGAGSVCSPTLSNLRFSGNRAAAFGGALYDDGSAGGTASPLIRNTTFSGNSASDGGAVYQLIGNQSSPAFANVTFAGNAASGYGGAIYNYHGAGSASIAMTNVTYSGNAAPAGGGAIADYNCGPGLTLTSTLTNLILWADSPDEVIFACDSPTFKNSVVQGSGGSAAWKPGFGTDGGVNLDADPKLGALLDNGGLAPTLMPGSGSSAINAGLDAACGAAPVSAIDQRGIARPLGAHCDVGAVEASSLILHVTDGSEFGIYGSTIQYVVTLWNSSPTDTVTGIHVSGAGSAALDAAGSSFCTFGACSPPTSSGPLDASVTLTPGSLWTWVLNVPVIKMANDTTATMTIHSSGAAAVSDTDMLAIFRGTFD